MGIDRFGMSLADRRMPALEETVDLPGLFDLEVVELPGVWLGRLALTTQLRREHKAQIYFSRLLDAGLTRQAPELEGKLCYDFQARFLEQALLARDLGAERIEADFDFARMLLDKDYFKKSSRLLRALSGGLSGIGLKLGLPLRLPQTWDVRSGDELSRVFGDLLLPGLDLALDLHIHEFVFTDKTVELLNALKYHISVIRVVYEPELGNVLNRAVLQPLWDYAGSLLLPVTVLITPVHAQDETLSVQLNQLKDLR